MLHLHNNYSFTESLVETVIRSLRHSCRSELTRQGTSLRLVTPDFHRGASHFCQPLHVAMQLGLYLHLPTQMSGIQSLRIPGAIPKRITPVFPADCPHPAHCHRLAAGSVGYSDFPANSRM